jgi:hypothetical protein
MPVSYDNLGLHRPNGSAGLLKPREFNVVIAPLEPDAFREWCNKNGLDMDAKARNRFAIEVAERSMSPKH